MSTLVELKEQIHRCSVAEPVKMMELYQEYLARLLNAKQVVWCAIYKGKFGRDLWHTKVLDDWKIVDIKFPLDTDFNHVEASKKYFKIAREAGSPDPQMMLSVRSVGQTRVHLLHEATSPEEWQNHWMKKVLAKYGVGERMVGAYTLSNSAESIFNIDRDIGAEPFTEEDREKLYEAMVSFPRLHDWLFLMRGLIDPASRPLSPREKEVLAYLLGPSSESEIAAELSLTKGTVHNYVIEIYKIFAVNSRHELVQVWMRGLLNSK